MGTKARPLGVVAAIVWIRGERVILDEGLADLYRVSTKVLNQAVQRNRSRFPRDFMFRLTSDEFSRLRSQNVTSNRRGGRRSRPYAFTEQGVAMLSSVLRSTRAVQVNIQIMRAFVRLRALLATHQQLARKLAALERKYDGRFRNVFEAIREMVVVEEAPQGSPKPLRRIGFGPVR